MINYYTNVDKGVLYKVDFESRKFDTIEYFRGIDYAYVVDEDGELIATTKDGEKTYSVQSGDLVLRMYSADDDYYNKEFIVIHSNEIKDYARRCKAFLEENSKKTECEDCDCAKVNHIKC